MCLILTGSTFLRSVYTSVKKILTVTVARSRDFAILQSKQQQWRMYGAGEGRVFDDELILTYSLQIECHFYHYLVKQSFELTELSRWLQHLSWTAENNKYDLCNIIYILTRFRSEHTENKLARLLT